MIRAVFVTALVFAIAAGTSTVPAPAQSERASDYISILAKEAIAMLADETLTIEERQEHFADVLRRALDLNVIGRFAIGKYWEQATPEQRATYLKFFGDFLIKKYSVLVRGYGGEAFNVLSETPLDDKDVLVRTQIERPEGGSVAVEWRARNREGRWRIVDAVVEGISFTVTQRSEFLTVIKRHGLDGLIEKLSKATAPVDEASDL